MLKAAINSQVSPGSQWKGKYEWEWGAQDCFAVELEGQGLQLFDSHQYSHYSRDPGSAVLDAAGACSRHQKKV